MNDKAINSGRDYLLFDGDCGICSRCIESAQRIDRRRRFVVEPYQLFAEDELRRHGLDYARCDRAVQVLTRRGRVYAGAFGVNCFLWHQGWWRLLVLLLYALPPLLLLELVGYRLVANQRARLSQWFGLKACRLKSGV